MPSKQGDVGWLDFETRLPSATERAIERLVGPKKAQK